LQIVADAILEIFFEDFAGCQIEFRVPNDAVADEDPEALATIDGLNGQRSCYIISLFKVSILNRPFKYHAIFTHFLQRPSRIPMLAIDARHGRQLISTPPILSTQARIKHVETDDLPQGRFGRPHGRAHLFGE